MNRPMASHEIQTLAQVADSKRLEIVRRFVDGKMVHRDCVADFENMEFIRAYCIPESSNLYWLDVGDILRTDWYIV